MKRTGLRAVVVVAVSLMTLGAGGALTQARPAKSDVELVHHEAAHRSLAAFPSAIDSDIYAYSLSPSFVTYFVVAGHLKLKLKHGSTTKYTGSLVDYDGEKSYSASANTHNATAPTLTLASANGTFTFTMDQYFGTNFYSGKATKVPPKKGFHTNNLYFSASAHTLRTATYNIVLSERVGPAAPMKEYIGTMTFAYDANNRISGGQTTVTDKKGRTVTHSIKGTGYYSTGYLYVGAKIDTTTFGISATFSGANFSGLAFTGSGSKASEWVLSGTPA